MNAPELVKKISCLFLDQTTKYVKHSWRKIKNFLLRQYPFDDRVTYSESEQFLIICNKHYIAKINRNNGELTFAFDRGQDGLQKDLVLKYDQLRIRTAGLSHVVSTSELSAVVGPTIVSAYDFYLMVTTRLKVEESHNTIWIERTYEFTKSPHIYEQIAFYTSKTFGGLSPPTVSIERLNWFVDPNREGVRATATADDLKVSYPPPSLRHKTRFKINARFRTKFVRLQPPRWSLWRIIVTNGKFVPEDGKITGTSSQDATIGAGNVLLLCAVISICSPEQTPVISTDFKHNCFQFYPGYGLLITKEIDPLAYGEIDWNAYGDVTTGLIPVERASNMVLIDAYRDCLIRLSMHIRTQMERDRWWPKSSAWSIYPNGDIFTTYTRSYPLMIYTWALLTVKRICGQWYHYKNDADVIYKTLQKLYAHFTPSGGVPHFEDILAPDGIPYISYSAHMKERNNKCNSICRGVINSHGEGIHFAWLMREASELYGDHDIEKKWRGIVEKYHQGSKALFRVLHPAKRGGKSFWGVLQYGIGRNKMEPWYNMISFQGIAAGYQQQHESNLEFVDAVERAYNWDYDNRINEDQRVVEVGSSPFVARLCRTAPILLSFVGKGASNWKPGMSNMLLMSHYIRGAASIREVLSFAKLYNDGAAVRQHDPSKFIVEGGNQQWILTNGESYNAQIQFLPDLFSCHFVEGFWEEKDPEDVPDRMRFDVRVTFFSPAGITLFPLGWDSVNHHEKRWTVSRRGDCLLVMTNYDAEIVRIIFPLRHLKYTIKYLNYDKNNHRWKFPPNLVDSGEINLPMTAVPNIELRLPQMLEAKSLAIIEIQSKNYSKSMVSFTSKFEAVLDKIYRRLPQPLT